MTPKYLGERMPMKLIKMKKTLNYQCLTLKAIYTKAPLSFQQYSSIHQNGINPCIQMRHGKNLTLWS